MLPMDGNRLRQMAEQVMTVVTGASSGQVEWRLKDLTQEQLYALGHLIKIMLNA